MFSVRKKEKIENFYYCFSSYRLWYEIQQEKNKLWWLKNNGI